MDHDLTTAPGPVAADGLRPGGPDTAGAETAGAVSPGVSRQTEPAGSAGQVSTVRLASPGSVIASIPYLFGFHPDNSLVVLGVSHSAEGGSFIRHGVRLDLEQVRGQERTTALELAARMRDQDADIAILVAFGPRGEEQTFVRVTPLFATVVQNTLARIDPSVYLLPPRF